MKAADECLARD